MFFLVTILITIFSNTHESKLPEHPQKSYYKSSLSGTYESNTTPRLIRVPDLFANNVRYPSPERTAVIKEIQYAPLQVPQERKEDSIADIRPTLTTTLVLSTTTPTNTKGVLLKKGHLEPLKSGIDNGKCYTPGLKVKGMQSVSRSPGHNVVYENIQSQLIPRDKSIKPAKTQEQLKIYMESTKKGIPKITYMRPYAKLQNVLSSDTTTMAPPVAAALNPVYAGKNQKTDKDRGIDAVKSKRQPASVSSKLHRLHLNIARVYSPGQVPQKSPVFVDTYPLPEETQTVLLPGTPIANKNTVMLPVPVGKPIKYM